MVRLARIASLVALLLLASVGTAFAECAWVLWTASFRMQGKTAVSQVITPSAAYAGKAECDASIADREAREGSRRAADPTRNEWYFQCYPDTIDPSGPKGK